MKRTANLGKILLAISETMGYRLAMIDLLGHQAIFLWFWWTADSGYPGQDCLFPASHCF